MKTTQIEQNLTESPTFDSKMIEENSCPQLTEMLKKLFDERKISRSDVIKRLNLDRSYGYQLFNGTRVPTRNCLIQIGLLLNLEIEPLQQLLKAAQKKPLYVRDMFDAKVFFAVKHKMSYEEAADFIWNCKFSYTV